MGNRKGERITNFSEYTDYEMPNIRMRLLGIKAANQKNAFVTFRTLSYFVLNGAGTNYESVRNAEYTNAIVGELRQRIRKMLS
jgi:hypothetical protein